MTAGLKPLVKSVYAGGVLMIVSALSGPLTQTLPWHFSNMQWRVGVVGLVADAFGGVVLGFIWILVAAVLLEHRLVVRILTILSFVTAAFLALILGMFVLDYVQVRGSINPAMKRGVDLSVLRAMIVIGAAAVAAVVVAFGGRKAAREVDRLVGKDKAVSKHSGLLVSNMATEEVNRS